MGERSEYDREIQRLQDELERALAREAAARDQAEHDASVAQALLKASSAISESVEPAVIAARLATTIHEATGRKRIWVQTWDESRRVMRSVAAIGEKAPPLGAEFDFDQVTARTRQAVLGHQTAVIDVDAMSPEERSSYSAEYGFRCLLVVPIVVGDTLIGVLGIDDPDEHNCFGEREIELIESIASQGAVVLQNARLFEAKEKELARSRLLQRVGVAAAAAIDLAGLGDAVLDAINEESPLNTGDLRFVDGDVLRLVAARGYPQEILDQFEAISTDSTEFLHARAFRGRRLVTHEDDTPTAERQAQIRQAGVADSRYVVLPVCYGDRVLGTFSLSFHIRRPFSDEELATYRAVADILGQAMENARLFEAEVQAERQAELELETTLRLLEAADALRDWTDLRQLGQALAEILVQVTSHARSIVDTYDEQAEEIVVIGSSGELRFETGSRWPLEKVSAATRRVVAEKRTEVADFDALSKADRGIAADPYRLRQLLYVPMLRQDRFIGMIVLDDPDEHREFTEREIDLVEAIAAQAASAVENARLYERQTNIAQLNEALTRIDASIHSTLKPREMLQRVVVEAAAALGCDSSAVDRRENGMWVVSNVHNFPAASIGLAFSDEQVPFAAWAAEHREVVVIDDAFSDPRVDPDVQREYNVRSVMVAPLIIREQVVAVMFFNYHEDFHTFSEHEIAFVQRLATSAGLALDNAQLYEEQRKRRRRIEALHGVLEVAVASLDLRESARHILEYLHEHHGFELTGLWLARGDALELLASKGYPPGYGTHFSPMPVTAPYDPARAFESGAPIIVTDAALSDPRLAEMYEATGVRIGAYIILPLRSRGEVIGTLNLAWREAHDVNEYDFDFYDSIAREVGLVLDNVRLYETERDIADRLQEALLSLPDEVRGIEFSHAYHSAAESARVGGDFYDLFGLDNDHVGIVIGDVAGKGLDAAVLTSMVKNTIRAHANERGKTPSQVLGLTNEVIFKATATESFVTVFFGLLDCRDGRLVYANAGHTSSALVRLGGDVVGLPATGSLLGAFPSVSFGQTETHIGFGEMLFLYTDGLTEARRNGDFYGEERLFALLAETPEEASASQVVHDVVDDVVEFSNNRLKDDLAILAVKRVGQGSERPQQQKLDV